VFFPNALQNSVGHSDSDSDSDSDRSDGSHSREKNNKTTIATTSSLAFCAAWWVSLHFVQGAISGVFLFEVMPWPDPAARNVSPKLNVRAQGAISGVLFEVMPWPDPAWLDR
jgi:hypothetical protein